MALLGSANGQWKAERHFEESGTSVNPVYRQTRQLEQYYSAYSNVPDECKAEAWVPFFGRTSCTSDCLRCQAAVVIVIQLGCDVIHEIKPITDSVISVLRQFEAEEATLPGALRLGLVRYGLKQDIKIDLTLLDDMNDFSNILEGILIKNIKAMKPASNAHLVPAFKVALEMFKDYDAYRQRGYQPILKEKYMWYITNGHLQCADCICYPEIGNPLFYSQNATMRNLQRDVKSYGTEKLSTFQNWMKFAANQEFVNEICTDFMTENDETSPCCFEETCGHSRHLRVCTARDFNRNDCSRNVAVKEHFITLMTFPQACSTLQSRMSLCYIRSRLLSMYHLDELKCDRQNQMVNIMITAPNQKACVYAKHTLTGVNRRIWTDNQFEDCHNAEMLDYFTKWNTNLEMCGVIFGRTANLQTSFAPTCAAYENMMTNTGVFHVNDKAMTDIVGNCLLSSAMKCVKPKCSTTNCEVEIFLPRPKPRPHTGTTGCPGARGPVGRPGGVGKEGALGIVGPAGPDARQGECGRPGIPGPDAYSPPTRVITVPGVQGGVGSDGMPGNSGRSGQPGDVGRVGKPGSVGIDGQPGMSGKCGSPGSRGTAGDRGGKGPNGPQGMPGFHGIGIESEEYYQKFKARLRNELEAALEKITINGIEVNGPRNAVLLYKQLAVLLAQEINIVCKEGHIRGVCSPGRTEIFYNWPESNPVCRPSDDGWVTVPPTVAPTAAPTPRPTRTIPVFISQETRPLVTIPPRTELETEATTEWEPVTSAVVTDEATTESSMEFDKSDSSTVSESDWGSDSTEASNSESDDTTGMWWGMGKRKRNTDPKHNPNRKFVRQPKNRT